MCEGLKLEQLSFEGLKTISNIVININFILLKNGFWVLGFFSILGLTLVIFVALVIFK